MGRFRWVSTCGLALFLAASADGCAGGLAGPRRSWGRSGWPGPGWLPCRAGLALGLGQVTSTQAPSWRARPRPARLRRFNAAVRRLSQAWFLAVPR